MNKIDDTISRQAAIDLLKQMRKDGDMIPWEGKDVFARIRKLPPAQPEIIHCGECTKMEVDSVFHDCWCSETGKKVWVSHYCGYAERREERR